ncbi:MAG: NAD(P)-dependent oxidoreductase, partial [Methyloligellaceae bacterium]
MTEPDLIGFVGLGNMGAPMVRNMLKGGRRVLLYDLRPEALQAFEGVEGCSLADSLVDLASRTTVAITMLPDSPAVRAAVLGDQGAPGLVEGLAPDSLIVDMSSSFPGDTRALGQTVASRSVGLVDAPVSGGVTGAVAGTLTIMAGGEDQLIDRVEAVLSTMGNVVRTGALGSGHATKALNNVLSAVALSATSEVLHVGMKFGLDPHIMTSIFNTSTGRNTTTENKVEQYLLNGS